MKTQLTMSTRTEPLSPKVEKLLSLKADNKQQLTSLSQQILTTMELSTKSTRTGHVTDANGTTIIEEGGKDALIEFLQSQQPESQFIYENTTYYVYKNGTVISEGGKTIVVSGGQSNATDVLVPTTIKYGDDTYYIFKDGHVTDVDGNTIIEEGGKDALIEYLNKESEKKPKEVIFQN